MTDKVVIVVKGGVAYTHARSANVEVLILDLDNEIEGGRAPDVEAISEKWFAGEPYELDSDGIASEYELLYENNVEKSE